MLAYFGGSSFMYPQSFGYSGGVMEQTQNQNLLFNQSYFFYPNAATGNRTMLDFIEQFQG